MRRERREHAGGSGGAAEWQGVTGDGGAERGGEGGWDDGVSAEHDVLVKKRRARSVDALAARDMGAEECPAGCWVGRGGGKAGRGEAGSPGVGPWLSERVRGAGGGGRWSRESCRVFRGTPRGSPGCVSTKS